MWRRQPDRSDVPGRLTWGGALKRGRFVAAILSLSLFLFFPAGKVLGLPCRGQIVNTGEAMAEVAAKCGEAALKEQRTVSVKETDKSGTLATTTTIDEWTYDFGPEELMQMYRFENGKLTEISSIGYGRPHDDQGENCRNGQLLAVGDTAVDAFLKCGDPLMKEKKEDKVTETEDGGTKRWTAVSVVEWTYRYGPDLPGYTLRFENGKVVEIRQRKFGE